MRKKRERKRKKRHDANAPIDEEKLERLNAVKAKREKTIATVKIQLEKKFKERKALSGGIVRKDEDSPSQSDEIKSSTEKKMMEIRAEMRNVITSGVEKVHAAKILQDKIKFDAKSGTLTVSGKKYKLKKNVHLVGWGYESLMLAASFEKIVVNHLKKGWIVVPRRTIAGTSMHPEWFPQLNTRISLTEAESYDTPDDACVRATKNIADYCKKLKKKDILIVALSPGGDDLLCLPKGTIGWREKMKLMDELRAAGATAREIGIVRKTFSATGGGLARLAYPAKVLSLVMSDRGSDDLHLGRVVDGPTIKEDTQANASSARKILQKYGFHDHKLSHSIREVLKEGESVAGSPVDPKKLEDERLFDSVSNFIAASSEDAVEEMAVTAFRLGYVPMKLPAAGSCGAADEGPSVRQASKEYTRILSLMILAVEGKINRSEMYEATRRSKIFDITTKKLLEIFPSKEKWARGLYILISPPPIDKNLSKMADDGRSGANQELSLYFSLYWYLKTEQYPVLKEYVVWFLGGSSAGRDGNTAYAGAYGYGNLAVDVYRKFKTYLSRRTNSPDSYAGKLGDERLAVHEAILPDRVLASGNANLLFVNVNDGDELLKLGNPNGHTHTNVGDLHIFRIVRCQCSCDGLCESRSSSNLSSLDP